VVLSAFHPIQAIKGTISRPGRTDWARKGMLIFQFAVSTGLIIGTGLMWRQLQFMQQQELGASLDQVLLIPGPQLTDDNYEAGFNGFQQELQRLPYISHLSFSGLAPGEGYNFQAPGLTSQNSQEGDDQLVFASASVDDQYFSLYDIPMLAGRNFRPQEVASFSWYDIEKVVLNETARKALRFDSPEAAIGEQITWWNDKNFEVIGVVPDHHHMSLQEAIRPMIFLGTENFGLLGLKMQIDDPEDQLKQLNEMYTRFFPGNPFQYKFADENFAQQYDDEKRNTHLFGLACSLAVFIACLGLLGLSIAGVKKRTKEIGVRRVLGATVRQLIYLLSRDYLLPLVLAFLIAIPIVSYLIRQWLDDFAYRIGMEWWIYAFGSLIVLLLAMFTVGTQAWRAARANPVESLRSE
jgi:putative ABC transport system permease protein